MRMTNQKTKYKLGEDVKGTCPNCFGRGRRQHLEYNGDDEVICMKEEGNWQLHSYSKVLVPILETEEEAITLEE